MQRIEIAVPVVPFLADSGKLRKGAYPRGRVDSIGFDDKSYQAKLTLAMQSRHAFPKDSSLKILTSGLLGEQYVGFDAGGDPGNLKEGDKFRRTQSAIVLEKVIGQFIFSKTSEANSAKPAPAK